MDSRLTLELGIDIMEDCENNIDALSQSLQLQHPENSWVVPKIGDIKCYYKYKFENMQAKYQSARLQEYLYAQKNDNDNTIPIELLKWYTTSKLYLEAYKKEVNDIIDEKMNVIREQQKLIAATIKQKKQNNVDNKQKNRDEIQTEKDVLKSIQLMPPDVINHITQYVFTKENKLQIYKKTDNEITKYVNATKLQILNPFLKIIKNRAHLILNILERKQTKNAPYKPSDYRILKTISGTTKSQITNILLKTINCYHYLLCITSNTTGYNMLYITLQNELLYIYKTIVYIARPEMNKRTNNSR